MKVVVIIPAAGLGTRMAPMPVGAKAQEKKAPPSKQFTELGGTPILIHTLRKFAAVEAVSEIWIALRENEIAGFRARMESEAKDMSQEESGTRRRRRASSAIRGERTERDRSGRDDIVLVHDAVRPFVTPEIIQASDRSRGETWRRHRWPARRRHGETSGAHGGRRADQSDDSARWYRAWRRRRKDFVMA